MTKKNETAVAVTNNAGYQLPAHLQNDNRVGLDQAAQNRAMPRMKVVQSQSNRDLRSEFGDGAVILTPTAELVAGPLTGAKGSDREAMSEQFVVTPVYHYQSFEVWSDLDDADSPTVLESTYDPDSEIARKSRNPNLRVEPYADGKFERQYVHALNYILWLETGHTPGEMCVWTYSRGDFQLGKNFNAALLRRGTSIYTNRFAAWSVGRVTSRYNWVGLQFADPKDNIGPFVPTQEQVDSFAKIHAELREAHQVGSINVSDPDDTK